MATLAPTVPCSSTTLHGLPSTVFTSQSPSWEPVLKEAKEAKIPVFLLDRSIDVKDKDLYMTRTALIWFSCFC
jgi:hypothetical protein